LCLSPDCFIVARRAAFEGECFGFAARLRIKVWAESTQQLGKVTALLVKPLLDLWVFEHGDTESGDYRDGDDDAWSVALAD
jgi:hypothetical protein